MALKFVAVNGLTISHGAGSNCSGGTFTVSSTESSKCMAEGKGMYRGTLAFSWSGGNCSGPPPGVPGSAAGSGTINVTATKNKADSQLVLRVDDTGTMSGTYTIPGPSQSAFTNQPVKISDAGQTKVKGE